MNNDLISRSALKKALDWIINNPYVDLDREIMEEIDNAPTVGTTCPNCDSGYAQGYSDGYLKGKEDRPQGEWIPVSERLPDIAKKCIVQLTDGHITIGSYHSIDKWTFQETNVRYAYPKESVIAWQPLPEAYKEAENEQQE